MQITRISFMILFFKSLHKMLFNLQKMMKRTLLKFLVRTKFKKVFLSFFEDHWALNHFVESLNLRLTRWFWLAMTISLYSLWRRNRIFKNDLSRTFLEIKTTKRNKRNTTCLYETVKRERMIFESNDTRQWINILNVLMYSVKIVNFKLFIQFQKI
jgi:hypothetical protein